MMISTAGRVQELELTNPLSEDLNTLIKNHFRNEYYEEIHVWALCHESKRKELFNFLTKKTTKSSSSISRPVSRVSNSSGFSQKSFLLQSSHCTIDFARAFDLEPRPGSRQNNPSRFDSPGTDICFHEISECSQGPVRNRSSPSSISSFLIKKLMKESSYNTYLSIAESYLPLLQTLSSVVDKRTSKRPIDELRTHPTISPINERSLNATRASQDHLRSNHMYQTMHSKSQTFHPTWKTPKTCNEDFFDPSDHCIYAKNLSRPYPPLEQSRPFSQFPSKEVQRDTQIQRPVSAITDSRRYRSIFSNKTCL